MKMILRLFFILPSILFAQTYYVCTGPLSEAMHDSYDCANANCSEEVVSMGCYEGKEKGYDYCKKCVLGNNFDIDSDEWRAWIDNHFKLRFPSISGNYFVEVKIRGCSNYFFPRSWYC